MIVEIIAVCLLALLKRFRLRYLLRTWTFYPILLVQLCLIAFQASLFFRYYGFTPFARYVEPAVILSFLPALLVFGLYKQAFAGGACIVAGTVLNRIVIAQNGGYMPVYPTLSYLTGFVTPETVERLSGLHQVGVNDAKLVFLADIIDYGYSILSIGDVLIHLFACIMLYSLIKAVNRYYDTPATQ
jgi:hypothetical protein